MPSWPLSRLLFVVKIYPKHRFFSHYALGFSCRIFCATGMYFITPFIFCSRSEPQVIHLYVSLVKDTIIVGISHIGHTPLVISGSSIVFLKKLFNDFSTFPLHVGETIFVMLAVKSENLFSVGAFFIV